MQVRGFILIWERVYSRADECELDPGRGFRVEGGPGVGAFRAQKGMGTFWCRDPLSSVFLRTIHYVWRRSWTETPSLVAN